MYVRTVRTAPSFIKISVLKNVQNRLVKLSPRITLTARNAALMSSRLLILKPSNVCVLVDSSELITIACLVDMTALLVKIKILVLPVIMKKNKQKE